MAKRVKITTTVESIPLDKALDEFITYCKMRNLRPATISYYETIISGYLYKVLDSKFPTCDITPSTVQDLIFFCRNELNIKDVSINSMLRGTRTIFYYFMKIGYTNKFDIQLIKEDKSIIETYTDEEINVLLAKPNKHCTFLEYRDWTISNFLLSTGCRLSTLINIKVKDINFDDNLITYTHTKNRKQQIVPLSPTLKYILFEYLKIRGDGEYLFCNAYGEQLKPSLLSHSLCDYNRKRGISKTGVHRWRHTFAKKWIMNGGDIFRLQKLLGHTDMSMVRNYVNIFSDDLVKDFDVFNPLENMNHNRKRIKMK
ncbi:MAG: tyrosine-type recombinase/integrase [Clostridium sp.]